MKGFTRAETRFSLCGLNCALCSMHLGGYCPGCGGGAGNQSCAIAKCSLEHGGVQFCWECPEYPCSRYEGFDDGDSFVPHRSRQQDIAQAMGFTKVVPVSGQTYSRKMDYFVVSTLSGIAQSASKFSYDMRLLQNFKEMEEPFEKSQIGSSAMPYKRNPMRSERVSSLSRYVMVDTLNTAITAGTQWFERTLDDSANKRIAVAEAFLGVDATLNIMMNVTDGLVVYDKVIRQRVMNELPFMATENIMMDAVKKGGNRQELHEKLRVHSQAAARVVKEEGGKNDLVDRIAADPAFMVTKEDIEAILQPEKFIGRSAEQVDEFLTDIIQPLLDEHADVLGEKEELTV